MEKSYAVCRPAPRYTGSEVSDRDIVARVRLHSLLARRSIALCKFAPGILDGLGLRLGDLQLKPNGQRVLHRGFLVVLRLILFRLLRVRLVFFSLVLFGLQCLKALRNIADRLQPPLCHSRADLRLERGKSLQCKPVALGRVQRVGDPARTHKHTRHGIVVTLRDCVELVIVAACTTHGHRLKGLRERVDLVVYHLLVDPVELQAVTFPLFAHLVEHRTNERLIDLTRRVDPGIGQQISSYLLSYEPIVGHILVEHTDKIVAIPPRPLRRDVRFVTVSVTVADHVHPVARPMFAEVGGAE